MSSNKRGAEAEAEAAEERKKAIEQLNDLIEEEKHQNLFKFWFNFRLVLAWMGIIGSVASAILFGYMYGCDNYSTFWPVWLVTDHPIALGGAAAISVSSSVSQVILTTFLPFVRKRLPASMQVAKTVGTGVVVFCGLLIAIDVIADAVYTGELTYFLSPGLGKAAVRTLATAIITGSEWFFAASVAGILYFKDEIKEVKELREDLKDHVLDLRGQIVALQEELAPA